MAFATSLTHRRLSYPKHKDRVSSATIASNQLIKKEEEQIERKDREGRGKKREKK
jgi:hypothetical protein